MPPKQTSAIRSSFSRKVFYPRSQLAVGIIETDRQPAIAASLHHGCRVDPHRLEALALEHLEHPFRMRAIPRFHGDVELGALSRHVEEESAVLNRKNIDAELSKPGGNLTEHAGLVGDGQPEGDDAVLALEFPHHDRGED